MRIIEDRIMYKKIEFDSPEELKVEAEQTACVCGDKLEITDDGYSAVITNWHQNGPRWEGYVVKSIDRKEQLDGKNSR